MRGTYSSNDDKVLDEQFREMKDCGCDVVVVGWYPIDSSDQKETKWGGFQDKNIAKLLEACEKHGLKLTFHIEPYKGRCADTLREDLEYLRKNYGGHNSFYRQNGLPMYYVYDSYLSPKEDWSRLLKKEGQISIRNTPLDCLMIGLYVDSTHKEFLIEGGFGSLYFNHIFNFLLFPKKLRRCVHLFWLRIIL